MGDTKSTWTGGLVEGENSEDYEDEGRGKKCMRQRKKNSTHLRDVTIAKWILT